MRGKSPHCRPVCLSAVVAESAAASTSLHFVITDLTPRTKWTRTNTCTLRPTKRTVTRDSRRCRRGGGGRLLSRRRAFGQASIVAEVLSQSSAPQLQRLPSADTLQRRVSKNPGEAAATAPHFFQPRRHRISARSKDSDIACAQTTTSLGEALGFYARLSKTIAPRAFRGIWSVGWNKGHTPYPLSQASHSTPP